jgi:hypothetical protein
MDELDRVVDVLFQMIMGMEADRRYTQFTFSIAGVEGIRRAIGYLVVTHEISFDDAEGTLKRYRAILREEHRKDMEAWRNEQRQEKS